MPLYMDVHKKVKGVTAKAVAEAHQKDLEHQGKHGVKFLVLGWMRNRSLCSVLSALQIAKPQMWCTKKRMVLSRTRFMK